MANNTRARRTARLSRALGIALTPKAAKYMERRPYGPGEHGRARKKQDSDYAVRLREKQRLRAQYGIREAQMTRAFEEARRTKGLTGENLIELLEMRLDALVLRAGFARTIAQARQLVGGETRERAVDPLKTLVHEVLIDLTHQCVEPRLRADLRDPRTHLTEADHANPLNGHPVCDLLREPGQHMTA